jgi:hypothetical protein
MVEQLLQSSCNIVTFASGAANNNIKFFLFGRDVSAARERMDFAELRCVDAHALAILCFQSSALYLIEMNVDTQSGRLAATLKSDSPNASSNVSILVGMIKQALQPLC